MGIAIATNTRRGDVLVPFVRGIGNVREHIKILCPKSNVFVISVFIVFERFPAAIVLSTSGFGPDLIRVAPHLNSPAALQDHWQQRTGLAKNTCHARAHRRGQFCARLFTKKSLCLIALGEFL